MVKRLRWLAGIALLVASVTCSRSSQADPRPAGGAPEEKSASPVPTRAEDSPDSRASADEDARRAFDDGVRALRAEQWTEAESSFRRSVALVKRPSALYNLAFVLHLQKRWTESLEILSDLLKTPDEDADAQYKELAKTLMVRVVAEQSAQRPSAAKAEPIPEKKAAPSPPPVNTPSRSSFLRAAPWITIGVGGALLASGAITGILAKNADDDVIRACPARENCDPALMGERDRVERLGRATDVLLVTGGVLVVGGVTWRLLLPSDSASSAPRAVLVFAGGRF